MLDLNNTHHLLGSQCGNDITAFQLALSLKWENNSELPEQSFKLNITNSKDLHLPCLGHLVITDYNTSCLSCCHILSSVGTPSISSDNAAGIPYIMASYNNPCHTNQPAQSAVYHLDFACPNPLSCIPLSSMILGPLFGIPYTSSMVGNSICPITLCEVLVAFGISKQTTYLITQEAFYQTTLLNPFPCLLLPHLAQVFTNAVVHHILFLLVDNKDTLAEHIIHCLLLAASTSRPVPSNKTWLSSLHFNHNTSIMLSTL